MEEIKKIVANAAVNAELENSKLSDKALRIIEDCLKTKDGSFLFQLYLKTQKGYVAEYIGDEKAKCSKYCYDNGVLINKYDIKNLDLLHIVESDNAAYYQSMVVSGNTDYKFDFNINSYLDLHKKLFSRVYYFAGEIRDEFIYKSCEPYLDRKTPFCLPRFIRENLNNILREMEQRVSIIKGRDDLVKYLAYYYGELNMIHPFREGNGRTLRTYFLLLVEELNKYFTFGEFELDYSLWNEEDKNSLIKYSIINSVNGDTAGIEMCFDKVVVAIDKKVRTRKI